MGDCVGGQPALQHVFAFFEVVRPEVLVVAAGSDIGRVSACASVKGRMNVLVFHLDDCGLDDCFLDDSRNGARFPGAGK